MPLATCPDCKAEVSTAAKACPKCGAPPPRTSTFDGGRFLMWALGSGLALALGIGAVLPLAPRADCEPWSQCDFERRALPGAALGVLAGFALSGVSEWARSRRRGQ